MRDGILFDKIVSADTNTINGLHINGFVRDLETLYGAPYVASNFIVDHQLQRRKRNGVLDMPHRADSHSTA